MVSVLLIQFDGKMKNLALAKLASHHRDQGDDVTFIDLSEFKSDITYGSKIFMGGSGYDVNAKLPEGIELLTPDYEKFNMDYSQGFLSRGCIRNCDFCIVRQKEGLLHDVNDDWIKHQKVIVMDNNFLASKKCNSRLKMFITKKMKVNFNQGLDIRLVDNDIAELLSKVDFYDRTFRYKFIYFAFDKMEYENAVRSGLKLLIDSGIKPYKINVYVLVGFDTDFSDDMKRFDILYNEYGVQPYVQVYNNRKDIPIIRHFARWVNKRFYKTVSWKDYYRNMASDRDFLKNEDLIW